MSLHVIFIDNQGQQLSDVTSNFTSVTIPQNAFIMRICDDAKSYSNSTLTKLFEIDNTFYSKVLEYTTKGDYEFIDINVSDFGGFTAIFNQLSAQFVGNNPPANIFDFSGYGGSGSGGNIDFSTIVTALNSIATALSALTNLSNLSNLSQLASIVTAQNLVGDVIKNSLNFRVSSNPNTYQNIFNGAPYGSVYSGNLKSFATNLVNSINSHRNVFSSINSSVDLNNDEKLLNSISVKLQNIETKLEQNLPFTTLAQVDVVTDYTQVVKGVGKNE